MKSRLWRALSDMVAFGAFTALAVLSTSVQAGNIYGAWDPIIGGSYANTGFRGEVTFFVPDGCLATANYYLNGNCGTGDMYLIDARVWLYDTTPPNTPPYPDLSGMPMVFSFSDPVVQLYGIDVAFNPVTGKNEVVGLDTEYVGPMSTGYSSPVAPPYLYLFFSSGANNESNRWGELDGGAYLQGCVWNDDEYCDPAQGERSNRGVVTYTPEPGTLALLFGGLGVGWFMRRRTVVAS